MHYSQKYIQYSFPLVSSFQTFFYFRVFFKQISNLEFQRNHQVHNPKTGNLPNFEALSQGIIQEKHRCKFPGNEGIIPH